MGIAILILTLGTVAIALGCAWGCAALARRWGIESSTGFAVGLVLGLFGVVVLGVRSRFRNRDRARGRAREEITW